MKKLLLSLILALTALSPLSTLSVNTAKAATTNTAIRGTTASTVFWYANDGKRYVFPNAATFYTWFPTFNNVVTISDSELFSIQIGGNVTYRPAAKLVKINTDPKVYAVSRGGVLRHVTSEFRQGCRRDSRCGRVPRRTPLWLRLALGCPRHPGCVFHELYGRHADL